MLTHKTIPIIAMLAVAGTLVSSPVFAQDNVNELKARIEALDEKVASLERALEQRAQRMPEERRWNPFEEMSRMEEQMNRMFQNSYGMHNPGMGFFNGNVLYSEEMNVEDKNNEYVVTFDTAGYDKDNLNIEVKNQSLTVSGNTSREDEQSSDEGYVQSKSFGTFSKTVALPKNADTQAMKSKMENGKLIITFPKKQG